MKLKFKVIYKNNQGQNRTVHFSDFQSAHTFAEGMNGIVLHA